MIRRIFHNYCMMVDIRQQAKRSVFSTISFVAVFSILVFIATFIANFSFRSSTATITSQDFQPSDDQSHIQGHVPHGVHDQEASAALTSTSATQVEVISAIVREEKGGSEYPKNHGHSQHDDEKDDDRGQMIPPSNFTKSERISWLKEKFPHILMFKPTEQARQFSRRLVSFFARNECSVRFFMTWISPAGSFGSRENLALETLFKSHPHACLIILSKSMDSKRGMKILSPFLSRGFRVFPVTPDIPFLFKGNPAEEWYEKMKKGKVDPGHISLAQNLSNLLRLVALYKYGGIYLDTDFIVLKDFSGLRNCLGAQSMNLKTGHWTRLNNAVLVFDKNHPLLFKFIQEFASTFNGNIWGHNGPYLVSRVVDRVSKKEHGIHNFTVLPPTAFYPVDWTRIGRLFELPKTEAHAKWARNKVRRISRETYGVHLWNKRSSKLRIEKGSIIGRLISDHCVICKHVYL